MQARKNVRVICDTQMSNKRFEKKKRASSAKVPFSPWMPSWRVIVAIAAHPQNETRSSQEGLRCNNNFVLQLSFLCDSISRSPWFSHWRIEKQFKNIKKFEDTIMSFLENSSESQRVILQSWWHEDVFTCNDILHCASRVWLSQTSEKEPFNPGFWRLSQQRALRSVLPDLRSRQFVFDFVFLFERR